MGKWLLGAALTAGVFALALLSGAAGFGIPSDAVLELRLVRVATGFVVGGSLAAAGAVMQAVLRNPLAEPYVLGVSSGAGLGAALAAAAGWLMPAGSAIGGALAMMAVYALAAGRSRGGNAYLLVLCGAVIAAMCSSILMAVVSLSSAGVLQSVTWWMMGGLQFGEMRIVTGTGIAALLIVLALWFRGRTLDAFALGPEMAHHLGVNVRVMLPLLLAAATILTAGAVALAGLIGFVGLLVPHAMRRMVGCEYRRLLPACVVFGGVFLVACDTLARSCLPPQEIPVGVITALCGGPFFLWQLCRKEGTWRI